jgi:hypothetical protein
MHGQISPAAPVSGQYKGWTPLHCAVSRYVLSHAYITCIHTHMASIPCAVQGMDAAPLRSLSVCLFTHHAYHICLVFLCMHHARHISLLFFFKCGFTKNFFPCAIQVMILNIHTHTFIRGETHTHIKTHTRIYSKRYSHSQTYTHIYSKRDSHSHTHI